MAETLESFKKKQEVLAGWLEGAADVIADLGHDKTSSRIREQAQVARDFTFRIAVVGEFSAGKSTLLNAFLKENLLPAKMPPCTAAPVSISFAEPRRLLVHRTGRKTPEERPFSELPSLVVLKSDQEEEIARERAASDIQHIEIQAPLEICRNRVSFFDTPGLNEAKARTEITLALLPKVDAAIVLMTSMHLLSQTERDFLEAEAAKVPADRRWMENAFVAVTFADVAIQDGGLDELKLRLNQYCDKLGLAPRRRYFVDSRSRLSLAQGKQAATDGIDFARLETDVADFVLRERGAAGWHSQLLAAQKAFGDATGLVDSEVTSLEKDAERVRAEAAAAKKALCGERDRLERMAAGMRKLGKRFARDLTNEFRAEAGRWLHGGLEAHLSEKEYPDSVIADFKKPAKWYSERAIAWIEGKLQHWSNEQPQEKLKELIEEFEDAYRDDLAEMKKNLHAISGTLGLSEQPNEEKGESGLGWLFQAAAGLAAGGPLGALVGASLGWKGVLTNLGVNFGLALAALMAGLSIPIIGWAAIAAVVAAAQIFIGQSGIKKRIKDKVLAGLQKDLPAKLDEAAEQVTAGALAQVEQLAGAILESGGAVLARMEEAAAAAGSAADRDTQERGARINQLQEAKCRLQKLQKELEAVA